MNLWAISIISSVIEASYWTFVYGNNNTGVQATSYPDYPGSRGTGGEFIYVPSQDCFYELFGISFTVPQGDTWQFCPTNTTQNWHYINGAMSGNNNGVYSAGGNPGARFANRQVYRPSSNEIWLFGGNGFPASGASGILNDFWSLSLNTYTWTWLGGSTTISGAGTYGPVGASSPNYLPCARANHGAVYNSVNDSVIIFGGSGSVALNDLWSFDFASSNWTLLGGSYVVAAGVYGTKGVADASNWPGTRSTFGFVYSAGCNSAFLVGGSGNANSAGTSGNLNDIWQFNLNTLLWTWLAGSSLTDRSNDYINMVPGGRAGSSVVFHEPSSTIYIAGGAGTADPGQSGWLNEVWSFDVRSSNFTFLAGVHTATPGISLNNPTAFRFAYTGLRSVNGVDEMFIFGGVPGSNKYLRSVWAFLIPYVPVTASSATTTTASSTTTTTTNSVASSTTVVTFSSSTSTAGTTTNAVSNPSTIRTFTTISAAPTSRVSTSTQTASSDSNAGSSGSLSSANSNTLSQTLSRTLTFVVNTPAVESPRGPDSSAAQSTSTINTDWAIAGGVIAGASIISFIAYTIAGTVKVAKGEPLFENGNPMDNFINAVNGGNDKPPPPKKPAIQSPGTANVGQKPDYYQQNNIAAPWDKPFSWPATQGLPEANLPNPWYSLTYSQYARSLPPNSPPESFVKTVVGPANLVGKVFSNMGELTPGQPYEKNLYVKIVAAPAAPVVTPQVSNPTWTPPPPAKPVFPWPDSLTAAGVTNPYGPATTYASWCEFLNNKNPTIADLTKTVSAPAGTPAMTLCDGVPMTANQPMTTGHLYVKIVPSTAAAVPTPAPPPQVVKQPWLVTPTPVASPPSTVSPTQTVIKVNPGSTANPRPAASTTSKLSFLKFMK